MLATTASSCSVKPEALNLKTPMQSTFSPFEKLASELIPHLDRGTDGAHDQAHLSRVWKNTNAIRLIEGGDPQILAAAVLLHDSVHIPKNSPLRGQASRIAGAKARTILSDSGWAFNRIDQVVHAIEAHSFSAKIPPLTIEAKVLQDADRLDALGYIGIARCFYVAGHLSTALYDPEDPSASQRPLNDAQFAIDHFRAKLLSLADTFQTSEGKRIARERSKKVQTFLEGFGEEIGSNLFFK
jgi:uncharacterized protein